MPYLQTKYGCKCKQKVYCFIVLSIFKWELPHLIIFTNKRSNQTTCAVSEEMINCINSQLVYKPSSLTMWLISCLYLPNPSPRLPFHFSMFSFLPVFQEKNKHIIKIQNGIQEGYHLRFYPIIICSYCNEINPYQVLYIIDVI